MEAFQQLLWSFGAIIALLLVFMLAVRFWRRPWSAPKAGRRLAILDAMAIDPEHRLILIRRDEREHLLLIGRSGAVVVEKNISEKSSE